MLKMWMVILLSSAAITSVAAGTIIDVEPVSFTSSVSSSTTGSVPCSNASSCVSSNPALFLLAGANATPISLSVSAGDGAASGSGQAQADGSFEAVEMVTISGGSGTGIASICTLGSATFEPMAGASVGLQGANSVPADQGEGCSSPGILGLAVNAFEFTYGVPFDFSLNVSADALANNDMGAEGFSLDVTGFEVIVVSPRLRLSRFCYP